RYRHRGTVPAGEEGHEAVRDERHDGAGDGCGDPPHPPDRTLRHRGAADRRRRHDHEAVQLEASCEPSVARRTGAFQVYSGAWCAESLAADSPRAEGARMGADLLERAGDGLDVGVCEVASEVLFDRVPVVSTRPLHRLTALVGKHYED